MTSTRSTISRDLFEISNARNLSREELVNTFVPTDIFFSLLQAKNQVILGSRGSGKTALVRMLAHDHLAILDNPTAKAAIGEKRFIGIYIPTNVEWVSSLKNKPWQSDEEAERYFCWKLNISACLAFLVTLRSCLEAYSPDLRSKAMAERRISAELSEAWAEGERPCATLRELGQFLARVEHKRGLQIARYRVRKTLDQGEDFVGAGFDMELFSPLKRAITLVREILNFPEYTSWLICIDEAEFLEESHHRILNSFMRSHSERLFFKMATRPYDHYTLVTNTREPLDTNHDFEYVYVDRDPYLWASTGGRKGQHFAEMLFHKRAEISGYSSLKLPLEALFGSSDLLDERDYDWTRGSEMWTLLERYANESTLSRANQLYEINPGGFKDSIARKMSGVLLLRAAFDARGASRKSLTVYSGHTMIERCADFNPRRLIQIFSALLKQTAHLPKQRNQIPRIAQTVQHAELTRFATTTLQSCQSEDKYGPFLHKLINDIGEFMRERIHMGRFGTDQISSIEVAESDSEQLKYLVKRAVGLGLLFPNVETNHPNWQPNVEGIFHLSYVLAPLFRLLPRKGKPVTLTTIQETSAGKMPPYEGQIDLFEESRVHDPQ